jgi:23S rRNA (uracil1939-C5)-methyltransferase
MARRKKKLPAGGVKVEIRDFTHEGRGVCSVEGKTVFVDGSLPGEVVKFDYIATRKDYDEGRTTEVIKASPDRVEARCEHFGLCGGCSLQHLNSDRQIQYKQDALISALKQIGGLEPEEIVSPLKGPSWGYRHKARLGVKYVPKKGRVLIGFRERQGRFLADVRHCPVLVPEVGAQLEYMADQIYKMQARDQIPQIEIGKGDNETCLVIRHLVELSESDKAILLEMARTLDVYISLQPRGPDSVVPLWPEEQTLDYGHPEFDVKIQFHPGDFIQVNPEINRQMVMQAIDWLDVQDSHKVLDLFCGLGNFTLPLARRAKEVIGVEGDQAMVNRARENALANGLENTRYFVENLMEPDKHNAWLKEDYDRILFDPPRSGAREIIPLIASQGVGRIVYVSCHPGSLARDAGELVNRFGYRLVKVGVMDMFPHTAHVESMALFVKD